ncbi:DUF1840 domain-containing protein [Polaromonas sp. YR568]|uniref:DUF1840 domain-containing protein n=1 Tax=Polaromonas sp. YR568 TaxID=1855301 RepID=UPI003137E088
MLYKFRSKDTGDVIMLEANGRRVLEIIGKDPGPKGIILPEQMPAAIEALEQAIALEHARDKEKGEEGEDVPGDSVSLHQRAMPLIGMLRRCHAAGHEVVWGV